MNCFATFYGLRRAKQGDAQLGAVTGVFENNRSNAGRRSHAHRSRNGPHHRIVPQFSWEDYKTGAGVERALLAQFHPLEEALEAMGVVVWPMIEFEADDALASAAYLAATDPRVQQVSYLDSR
jgi:hypothetical protein